MHTLSDCHATLRRAILTVGNRGIERTWDLAQGAPMALSIRDRARRREWVRPAPYRDAFRLPWLPLRAIPAVRMEADRDDADGTAEDHLRVTVTLGYASAELVWVHRVWPALPIVVSQFSVRRRGRAVAPPPAEPFFDSGDLHLYPSDDRLDFFGLRPFHLRFKAVAFLDHTDSQNNLVAPREGLLYPKEHLRAQGNLLHLADLTAAGGVLALKLGPSPVGHLHYPGWDFAVSGRSLAIVGSGVGSADLAGAKAVWCYGSAVGVTDGREESAEDLCHALMGRRWKMRPARDFSIMSNTWGDRLGQSAVGNAMVGREIKAAGRIGLTHCQIDAGWQRGSFAALSVESSKPRGPYAVDAHFWDVDARKFPRGFGPVVRAAARRGLRLGLWFTPDATDDYAAWEKDAAVVLALCRTHGFDNVKLDGVSIRSKKAERNFTSFLNRLRKDSHPPLCTNLDLTAGRRTGYFYLSELAGNIFLENRYTLEHSYFPHWTLRNLWQLSRYLPTRKFQIEFLNPALNAARYRGDPLAPRAFGIEYAFAVAMMANPLCWMEAARLRSAVARRLGRLVLAYRPHQEGILHGRVYPIGSPPDGTAWTGFQSVTGPGRGYLLVFREWNRLPAGEFELRQLAPGARLRLTPVAGASRSQERRLDRHGRLRLALPAPRTFTLFRYEADHYKDNRLPRQDKNLASMERSRP